MTVDLRSLPENKKRLVLIGCCALMLFVTSSSSTLLTLQTPILAKLGALESFALATITTSIGLAIMTPIGGKLGDIFGRRTMMIWPPLFAALSLVMVALAPNFPVYLIGRTLLGIMQGAYISAPYVLVSQIGERKDVPKYMGYLAIAMALGAFIGPFISGLINDAGYLELALMFPAIFPIIAIICSAISLPKMPGNKNVSLDIPGIIVLSTAMIAFVLTATYMPSMGITNPLILIGLAVTIISLIVFVKLEKSVEAAGKSPIISIRLLTNKEYVVLLIIGMCCYFYQTPMVSYRAQGFFQVMGQESASLVGLLNLPRTLVTIFLPGIVGVWIAKRYSNQYKAMALGSGLVAIACLPLIFISPSTSIIMLLVSSAFTGIAESFRSVSITPAAQDLLAPEDLSSGTALVNFCNTLASVLSSSMAGFAYNLTLPNVQQAISNVFILIAAVSVIGFLLAVLYIRPRHLAREKSQAK